MDASELWGPLADEPVFVLTGDQDWAPEWATAAALELAADLDVPMHIFATNDSAVLRESRPGVTLGIHPNFLPGSSHGGSTSEVLDHCQALYPDAGTVRSHCFAESTPILRELAARGFHTDSNLCLHLQPGITPAMHASGMVRLPVYLEDDVLLSFVERPPAVSELAPTLLSPGLKVLNFHPALVAINAPTLEAYERARPAIYGEGRRPEPSTERGVRDFLIDVVELVHREGLKFHGFPDVAADAGARFAAAFPAGLAGWRRPRTHESPAQPKG